MAKNKNFTLTSDSLITLTNVHIYELVGISSLHVVEFYYLLFRVLQNMIVRLLDKT